MSWLTIQHAYRIQSSLARWITYAGAVKFDNTPEISEVAGKSSVSAPYSITHGKYFSDRPNPMLNHQGSMWLGVEEVGQPFVYAVYKAVSHASSSCLLHSNELAV
jgi:hypothetical protein